MLVSELCEILQALPGEMDIVVNEAATGHDERTGPVPDKYIACAVARLPIGNAASRPESVAVVLVTE